MNRLATLPTAWWARQSLRARLTLLATALFTLAVTTGAVLVLVLQRAALLRTLDASALKTAGDTAQIFRSSKAPPIVFVPTTGGVTAGQVVDGQDRVVAVCCGSDRVIPLLDGDQLRRVREGNRITITSTTGSARLRVLGANAGDDTVIIATDLKGVDDSVRLLGQVALIGGPLAVLLMALATYGVVALTLRSVAALRHGAADITAAGLAAQRLPVPAAHDEIHRLATTLNAMLDRIDTATTRQRTFVGDAAHELRSPLASIRVQLEVAQRVGPAEDLDALVQDVLVDVGRLDRLVHDLLALARLDEAGGQLSRTESVALHTVIADVVASYGHARVPVAVVRAAPTTVLGDGDALRRVVINLVDNAVRYARSRVEISLDHSGTGGHPTATLRVVDDGRGIEPAERDRVFDRFYRVHASRSRESGGTGLGLSIVREMVRGHGGTVALAARADGRPGLVAVVILPRADDDRDR